MNVKINESWKRLLTDEFEKDYFQNLVSFVKDEYVNFEVYPPAKSVFRAFDETPFDAVRVVILGQDPYHGPSQANGLCFSVNRGVALPPSLKNIYKELASDLGCGHVPPDGELSVWALRGVLLLNSTLTVKSGLAASHAKRGWEIFTDKVVEVLSTKKQNLVFLLWGNYAQQKGKFIDESKHLVLKCAHPSPLSAHNGFFGCKHFSKANEYLGVEVF
jgi:uracil-DNA glycosylase